MNKILYLILILVVIVLCSSFIKYENFTTTFKLKFEKCEEIDGYPDDDPKRFSIQYKNNTCENIKVWLDDQPFCLPIKHDKSDIKNSGYPIVRNKDEGQCIQGSPGDPANWKNLINSLKTIPEEVKDKNNLKPIPIFSVWTKNNGIWTKEDTPIDKFKRSQILKPGQVWRIQPPTIKKAGNDRSEPYMCFDQYCDPREDNFEATFDKEPWKGRCVPFCNETYCKTEIGEKKCKPLNEFQNKSDEVLCYNRPHNNKSEDEGIRRNCPGTGAWITRENDNMKAIDGITKVEYNNNDQALWFDVSSVDGINTNVNTEYTGGKPACPQENFTSQIGINSTKCNLDIDNPQQSVEKSNIYFDIKEGVPTFPSLKDWPHNDKGEYFRKKSFNIDLDNMDDPVSINLENKCPDILDDDDFKKAVKHYIGDGTKEADAIYQDLKTEFNKKPFDKITDKPVPYAIAGCQPGDANSKKLCHLWWSNPKNKCAKDWLDFIQGNNNCQQYAWAYDEMRFGMDENGNQEFWGPNGEFPSQEILDKYGFNKDGNPQRKTNGVFKDSKNKVRPLLKCNIDKRSFNISINKIMEGTDPNIEKKQELCKKLQENWRYILESKNDKCNNKPQEECKSEDGCVFDGGKCHTNGTLCGTINSDNEALNCYQYSGDGKGKCSPLDKEECNDKDPNAPRFYCDLPNNYSNLPPEAKQKIKDSAPTGNPKLKCFTPETIIREDNYMNDEDIGYNVDSNWSDLKPNKCLFPRYYLDN